METTLRSIGRGVGHTHGCLCVLGEVEEERRRRRRRALLGESPEMLKY